VVHVPPPGEHTTEQAQGDEYDFVDTEEALVNVTDDVAVKHETVETRSGRRAPKRQWSPAVIVDEPVSRATSYGTNQSTINQHVRVDRAGATGASWTPRQGEQGRGGGGRARTRGRRRARRRRGHDAAAAHLANPRTGAR